ncbi:wax ester/triacylglycerol synthase domain-containing protein [Rhodococcus sp. MEB064]|uniref:wax ester/triacylglycerol synthase domain-containing protein n=1 Tax=Rhodococcus sp. MEB064 TaxID=1587522 RepID=UPI0005AC42F9|nr:wax ester/triacylglycerol synthase domain-containing protein [Rhodococcus sp. MEB064]KIQ15367.1 hypothetical protein RU01_15260 [Rhodococcus sp. MEB064]
MHPKTVGVPMHARDALNYYFESSRTSASVVHCYAFDVAGVTSPLRTHADALEFGEKILGLDPVFRRRLQKVPGHLAFPHWVTVDVDVARHVFVHTPAPDRSREFLVSKIVEFSTVPLDWDLPPWQFHFILDVVGVEGVPHGGTVAIFRSHHSAIDGMGVVEMLNRILSDEPVARGESDRAVAVPGVWSALRALPRDVGALVSAVARRRSATKAASKRGSTPSSAPHRTPYPATRFNYDARVHQDGPDEMTYAFLSVDFARVRAMKNAYPGVTVNDVMLTVVSLALSSYLDAIGEIPDRSLGTTIPVSTRAMADSTNANRIAIATLPLHTDIESPTARLLAVHASASAAKKKTTDAVTHLPAMPLTVTPAPFLKAISVAMRAPSRRPTAVATNTMITNVPYGRGPLTLFGAPMVGVFGPLPTVQGVYLAHSISTFGTSMFVSVASVRAALPDPAAYVLHIESAVDRLANDLLADGGRHERDATKLQRERSE